jgi:molecular chaperone DnaJ
MAGAKRDYYELLGIERSASADDLKRAYRKRAMELHPDRNPGGEEAFKECSEAYAVLSDAEKRRRYDRLGHAAFGGANGGVEAVDLGAMGEILESLLGEVFGRGRRAARMGRDVEIHLEVSFEEAALGAEKTVELARTTTCAKCQGSGGEPGTRVEPCTACSGRGEQRFQRGFFAVSRPCETCHGTGKRVERPCGSCAGAGVAPSKEPLLVRLPAGVEDGSVRTMRGAGEAGAAGPGDLHVHVHVRAHPLFTREGADVACTVPVSFPQAALGAQIDVPTLEGKVKMRLPPGTASGKIFRLRGKGLPVFSGAGKGDQLVKVVVEVPEQLSPRARELVEQLAGELGADSQPERESFLDKLRSLFDG